MPVIVKHSGLRMVAVNKDSVRLLDDTWDLLGVYFLFGHGSEPERYTAYVGEAGRRPLRVRLREHVRTTENWNRALLITSDSSEGFDSAAIGWIEGRLYAVLKNATAAEVLNRNTPQDESLPPYEREALEGYIKPIMAAMRALGYPPDTPDQRPPASRRRQPRRYSESLSDLLEAGLLRADTPLSPLPSAFDRTAIVLADGRLRVGDQEFDTPSGAGAHVAGRQTNGWDFWGAPSGDGGLKSLSALRDQLRGTSVPAAAPADGNQEPAAAGQSGPSSPQRVADDQAAVAEPSRGPEAGGAQMPSYRPMSVTAKADVTVDHLYQANLLDSSTIVATYKGERYEATPYGDGELRFPDERSYPTLSAAARAITGCPTNGWEFWKTERDGRAVSLAKLRDELLALEPEILRSEELRAHHVPPDDAPWSAIIYFALRFNGYEHVGGDGAEAVETLQRRARPIHEQWQRSGELPGSLDELRLALFAEERQYKWTDMSGGDPENMPYVRSLVSRIREVAGVRKNPPTVDGSVL